MRIIIFALLPLLVGCTNVQNKGIDSGNTFDGQLLTFHLNAPPSKVEPLLLSEIADSVGYVALETTKETLTTDALQYGNRYYTIVNKDSLLCFDKNGKFLHRIGRKGKGPEEYPWIFDYNDYKVDPVTNWVYISSDSCTQVYDENGKYAKTLRGGYWHFLPELVYNHMAYFTPITHHPTIEIIDESNNLILTNNKDFIQKNKQFWKELYDNYKKEGGFEHEATDLVHFISNDAYYTWSVFYDTVMMARGKEVKPFCRIIPDKKYMPEDCYSKSAKELLQPLIARMYLCKNKLLLLVRYYPSFEKALAFHTKPKENTNCCYWVVCDLKDGSVTYHTNYIINDLDGGPNVLLPIYRVEDIYSLNVEDLKNDEDIYNSYFTKGVEAKLKDQDGKFQRLFESLADDANPIIRTIHWKE
ncbi:MAG: 6-bladed beta-propeller [Bacteroidales bacterium]|nr:6-bladed beta-propeller [Bacteroidales bacterium]